MQALILAGGEGTRLRPLTLTTPKSILPLAGRPFLSYMLEWLARHGVDEVLLGCGFGADAVRGVLGDAGPGGLPIRYLVEPEPLGTAGPIKFAEEELGERFLVLNGDVLQDLDLEALLDLHEKRGAAATISLYPVPDPAAYGLVRHEPDGEVLEFVEKPDPDQIDTDEISAGAYVLERSVLELIPAGRAVSIEREVFPKLVGRGLYGKRLEGYWNDIGTPERYLDATWAILEGRLETGSRPPSVDAESAIAADAGVEEPVLLQAGVVLEAGARVGPRAVVGEGCRVGPGARIEGSVLHPDCRIGEGATVSGSILGPGVQLGEGVAVPAGTVIGEGARIAAGTQLSRGDRIAPGSTSLEDAVMPDMGA